MAKIVSWEVDVLVPLDVYDTIEIIEARALATARMIEETKRTLEELGLRNVTVSPSGARFVFAGMGERAHSSVLKRIFEGEKHLGDVSSRERSDGTVRYSVDVYLSVGKDARVVELESIAAREHLELLRDELREVRFELTSMEEVGPAGGNPLIVGRSLESDAPAIKAVFARLTDGPVVTYDDDE